MICFAFLLLFWVCVCVFVCFLKQELTAGIPMVCYYNLGSILYQPNVHPSFILSQACLSCSNYRAGQSVLSVVK